MPTPPHTTVPTTLKGYYAKVTGDATTHQRTVGAHFKNLQPRRKRIIEARIAGDSLSTIAKREGITHGTVASDIKRGWEAVRKAIAGEPKYNKIGRRPRPKVEG
jgi:DNA-directed RNA polymerase specialized sigma24 family protein